MKYKLHSFHKRLLADTLTPVNIYLKLRDVFVGSILLESSDYHGHENSLSFICCDAIASFSANNREVLQVFPDGQRHVLKLDPQKRELPTLLENFKNSFEVAKTEGKYNGFGLFGYTSYDA